MKIQIPTMFFTELVKKDKTLRFIISTVVLTFLMLLSTFFFFDKAIFFIPVFIVATYVFTFFSVLEDIEKIEWLMLFLIPVLFTVSAYLFFFLFPIRWLTRLPFVVLYAISIHAIFRSSNIFNVGVEKSLQLYRAAFSVNFFYHTVIVFFFSNFLYSLKLPFYMNSICIFCLSFVLALHLFWTIRLNLFFESHIVRFGLGIALVLAEITTILSFVNLEISILALLTTVLYYSLTGLTYSYLDQRLFKETIREYIIVLGFVIGITILTSIK